MTPHEGALPATSHLKLALVESQDLGRVKAWAPSSQQYSNRVSSLTPTSVGFLKGQSVFEFPLIMWTLLSLKK